MRRLASPSNMSRLVPGQWLWTYGRYDLINASLMLPLIERGLFVSLWPNLREAAAPSGIICGHLFGIQDWEVDGKLAWGLAHEAVLELLGAFEVTYFHEHLGEGFNQSGESVTKHIYSFAARVAA
jgi:tellurite methyltransferase